MSSSLTSCPCALTYLLVTFALRGPFRMLPPPIPVPLYPGAHCVRLGSSCNRFTGEETEAWRGPVLAGLQAPRLSAVGPLDAQCPPASLGLGLKPV